MTPAETIAAAKDWARVRCRACSQEAQYGFHRIDIDHTCHSDLKIVEDAMLAAVDIALERLLGVDHDPLGVIDDLKAEIERQFGPLEGSKEGRDDK